MPESTRREALISIAACGVAAQALDAADDEPEAFAANQFRLLEQLVDMIIPDSDAAADPGLKRQAQGALFRLSSDGFADMGLPARTAVLTDYMIEGGQRRQHFQLIKGLTVDRYYATEIGLVQELGYQGNTYLAEFPGCEHEEHA